MCESCAVLAERGSFSEIGCAEAKESGLGERGAGKCGSFIGQAKLRILVSKRRVVFKAISERPINCRDEGLDEGLGHAEERGGKRVSEIESILLGDPARSCLDGVSMYVRELCCVGGETAIQRNWVCRVERERFGRARCREVWFFHRTV